MTNNDRKSLEVGRFIRRHYQLKISRYRNGHFKSIRAVDEKHNQRNSDTRSHGNSADSRALAEFHKQERYANHLLSNFSFYYQRLIINTDIKRLIELWNNIHRE